MIQVSKSGDGSRGTTSGGVDNIGAGEKFIGKHTSGGDIAGPAPKERMSDKRASSENSKHDDLGEFGLHEDLSPTTNEETSPDLKEMPVNQPKD